MLVRYRPHFPHADIVPNGRHNFNDRQANVHCQINYKFYNFPFPQLSGFPFYLFFFNQSRWLLSNGYMIFWSIRQEGACEHNLFWYHCYKRCIYLNVKIVIFFFCDMHVKHSHVGFPFQIEHNCQEVQILGFWNASSLAFDFLAYGESAICVFTNILY